MSTLHGKNSETSEVSQSQIDLLSECSSMAAGNEAPTIEIGEEEDHLSGYSIEDSLSEVGTPSPRRMHREYDSMSPSIQRSEEDSGVLRSSLKQSRKFNEPVTPGTEESRASAQDLSPSVDRKRAQDDNDSSHPHELLSHKEIAGYGFEVLRRPKTREGWLTQFPTFEDNPVFRKSRWLYKCKYCSDMYCSRRKDLFVGHFLICEYTFDGEEQKAKDKKKDRKRRKGNRSAAATPTEKEDLEEYVEDSFSSNESDDEEDDETSTPTRKEEIKYIKKAHIACAANVILWMLLTVALVLVALASRAPPIHCCYPHLLCSGKLVETDSLKLPFNWAPLPAMCPIFDSTGEHKTDSIVVECVARFNYSKCLRDVVVQAPGNTATPSPLTWQPKCIDYEAYKKMMEERERSDLPTPLAPEVPVPPPPLGTEKNESSSASTSSTQSFQPSISKPPSPSATPSLSLRPTSSSTVTMTPPATGTLLRTPSKEPTLSKSLAPTLSFPPSMSETLAVSASRSQSLSTFAPLQRKMLRNITNFTHSGSISLSKGTYSESIPQSRTRSNSLSRTPPPTQSDPASESKSRTTTPPPSPTMDSTASASESPTSNWTRPVTPTSSTTPSRMPTISSPFSTTQSRPPTRTSSRTATRSYTERTPSVTFGISITVTLSIASDTPSRTVTNTYTVSETDTGKTSTHSRSRAETGSVSEGKTLTIPVVFSVTDTQASASLNPLSNSATLHTLSNTAPKTMTHGPSSTSTQTRSMSHTSHTPYVHVESDRGTRTRSESVLPFTSAPPPMEWPKVEESYGVDGAKFSDKKKSNSRLLMVAVPLLWCSCTLTLMHSLLVKCQPRYAHDCACCANSASFYEIKRANRCLGGFLLTPLLTIQWAMQATAFLSALVGIATFIPAIAYSYHMTYVDWKPAVIDVVTTNDTTGSFSIAPEVANPFEVGGRQFLESNVEWCANPVHAAMAVIEPTAPGPTRNYYHIFLLIVFPAVMAVVLMFPMVLPRKGLREPVGTIEDVQSVIFSMRYQQSTTEREDEDADKDGEKKGVNASHPTAHVAPRTNEE